MFNHIGRKLKGIAAAWAILGVTGSAAAGVLLYLGKTLDLLWCIVIGAGGIILSLLGAMIVYGIGDTHAKLERLEEHLSIISKHSNNNTYEVTMLDSHYLLVRRLIVLHH